MTLLRRTLLSTGLLATVALLAVPLGGCTSIQRFFTQPEFELPETMPSDFALGLQVKEATQPPIDYLVQISRSGKVTYTTTIRAPRRREFSGEAELAEAQVLALYEAVKASQFDLLDDSYVGDSGTRPDVSRGVRYFYVYAAAMDKRVDVHLASVAQLDDLQARVLEVLPKQVLDATAAPGIDRTVPSVFVADTAAHMFHLPGCERAKAVSPAGRKDFKSQYEALDFGFHPCPTCDPMNVKK